ncbi:MAG: YciI family protein [Anaerolineae bacterium]
MSEPQGPDDMPQDMEVLFLGLLRRGPRWTPEVTPEVEALQEAHLANIARMKNSGELLVAGPFGDDGDLRGVYVFRVGSLEEALALTETDPSVKAGRLIFELHPWWVKKGVFGERT